MTDAVPVENLADPIWTLINAIEGVNTYDGEFVDADGRPVKPPADQDGRVHAYAIYYPSPGWAHALLACGGTDSLDFGFQITCAGADRVRTLWCVSQVRQAMTGATVTIRDQELQIREENTAAPIRRDDKVQPPRMHVPLLFATNA